MSKTNGLFQNLIKSYGRKSKKTIAVVYILSFILMAVSTDSYYKITAGAGMVEVKSEIRNEHNIETLSFDIEHTKDIEKKLLISNDNPDNLNGNIIIEKIETLIIEEELPIKEDEVQEKAKSAFAFDKESKEILERIVQAEAGGEDQKGKVLVANVIINRVKSKQYPNTIEKVVFQKVAGKYQFSPILDKRYWSVKVSESTKKAVEIALDGEDYSDGALFFLARKHASKRNLRWFDNNLKFLFQHGAHEFYRNK